MAFTLTYPSSDISALKRFLSNSDSSVSPVVAIERGSAVNVPAGASTTVVKAAKGILRKVVVIAAGTVSTSLYDNASTNSGLVLFTTPATTPLGTIYDLELPCSSGITAVGSGAGAPQLTVAYY